MVSIDLSRKTISALLGARLCTENRDGEEVCLYANARGDGKIFIKVAVDGKTVARAVFKPSEIVRLLVPAVFTATAEKEDIETLWGALKKKSEKSWDKARKTARKKRVEREEEEENGEEEEGLELL